MDSILKRASFTAVSNIIRAVISFYTVIILAKSLGPLDYGRMTFLLSTFIAIKSLLDMGTSSAFFTFLSRKRMSFYFVRNFWLWVLLQFLISLIVVGFILPQSSIEAIWKGETRLLVILALIAVFMQFTVWPIASQMAEASRENIKVQKVNLLTTCFHSSIIVFLASNESISLKVIFCVILIEWSLAGFIVSRFYKYNISDYHVQTSDDVSSNKVFRSFILYCLPFIPYVWLGFASEFADRWILQSFGGAVEQAYFSIGLQFASIALIATASVVKIFWKEVAELNENGHVEEIKNFFLISSRSIFIFTALLGCYLVPCSEYIIVSLLGNDYINGSFALSVLFIYPIHQSLGQISSTIFLAIGLTTSYVVIGCFHCIVSIIIAYIVVAPNDAIVPGLGLGSKGLAIKMIVVQFISVNCYQYWLSKKLSIKYDFSFQLFWIINFIIIGYVSKYIIENILTINIGNISDQMIFFTSYTSIYLTFIYVLFKILNIDLVERLKFIRSKY